MRDTKSYGLARLSSDLLKTMSKRTPQTPEAQQKLIRRVAAARKNGSYGGQQRADVYESEVLSEWAAQGGKAVLAKYGLQYFTDLRKRRVNYPKYSQEEPAPGPRINPRMIAGKENGKRGGYARAQQHSAEERSEWARRGGEATQKRHGSDFYREIRKLRKTYRIGYQTEKTKERQRKYFESLATNDPDSPLAAMWRVLAKKPDEDPVTSVTDDLNDPLVVFCRYMAKRQRERLS